MTDCTSFLFVGSELWGMWKLIGPGLARA